MRVHVLHDQVVRQFNEHTHAPDGQRGTVLTVIKPIFTQVFVAFES